MSAIATRRFLSTTARRLANKTEEKASSEASNGPGIAIAAGVTVAFAGAAFYFRQTEKAGEETPWDEATLARHKATKEAPSALNAVVVPNMTLPKDVHDRLNKWGKEGYP